LFELELELELLLDELLLELSGAPLDPGLTSSGNGKSAAGDFFAGFASAGALGVPGAATLGVGELEDPLPASGKANGSAGLGFAGVVEQGTGSGATLQGAGLAGGLCA
jgi:hypothetical protein